MRREAAESILLCALAAVAGCVTTPLREKPSGSNPDAGPRPRLVAARCHDPVRVDGRLDEPVWAQARAYPLRHSVDDDGGAPRETGVIRLAWDDAYLYLAAELTDTDVTAEGADDQLAHWQKGDVIELFLAPTAQTWYWELYVTPGGKKTSYWFPGRGRLGLPSSLDYSCGLTVAAQVAGTLNHWPDRDHGWTAEMAMPISDLTARGETFADASTWRIFVGRYNYGRYLPGVELSMTPPLTRTDFHRIDEYGILELSGDRPVRTGAE